MHDLALWTPGQGEVAPHFHFEPRSESRTLDPAEYGSSWASEELVRSAVDAAGPGSSCFRAPRGFCNFQDLYLVVAEPGVDFRGLALDAGPQGLVDTVAVDTPGRGTLRGWAWDANRASPPRAVEVFLAGRPGETVTSFAPRDDSPGGPAARCGWELGLDLAGLANPGRAPLLVLATGASGATSILHCGTLASARQAHERLRLEGLFHEASARYSRLGWSHRVLETRIAAMEASRFWRLRNAWFRVKRALGMTSEP